MPQTECTHLLIIVFHSQASEFDQRNSWLEWDHPIESDNIRADVYHEVREDIYYALFVFLHTRQRPASHCFVSALVISNDCITIC